MQIIEDFRLLNVDVPQRIVFPALMPVGIIMRLRRDGVLGGLQEHDIYKIADEFGIKALSPAEL